MSQSDQNSDRIRLAEAMGKVISVRRSLPYPNGIGFQDAEGNVRPIPNPFTDANDDYAVLEWMRTSKFCEDVWPHLRRKLPQRGRYRIGDNARVALRMLRDCSTETKT